MHFPSNTSREWNAPWENKQHSCAKTVLTIKALKKAAACQEDTRRVHAGIHTCMSACTHFCLSSGQARKIQWSMCSPRERKRREGGGGREFLPAGSYLTTSIIMPSKRTFNLATHPKTSHPQSLDTTNVSLSLNLHKQFALWFNRDDITRASQIHSLHLTQHPYGESVFAVINTAPQQPTHRGLELINRK